MTLVASRPHSILVRYAFGNLRDVLMEISFSPMMSSYLTFLGSNSLAKSKSAPDENYAREIMQLFSIGLWQLNMDGTQKLDASGEPLPTYDNTHIVSFAKVWTGFDLQPWRSNLESPAGHTTSNFIDPLLIHARPGETTADSEASSRDLMPKWNLYDGHLGDAYPLCADFGERPFLRHGARYSYLGTNPRPKLQYVSTGTDGVPIVQLNNSSSALYHKLCHSHTSSSGGCDFASEVTLNANLECDGVECEVDTAVVVQVTDRAKTVYYEFEHPACTVLTFTHGPTQRLMKGRTCGGCSPVYTCDVPESTVGGAVCCGSASGTPTWGGAQKCVLAKEAMTYHTAKARCAASGKHVCHNFKRLNSDHTITCGYASNYGVLQWVWVGEPCKPNKVQVDSSGLVTLVQPSTRTAPTRSDTAGNTDPALAVDSGNMFNVRWADGRYPTVEEGGCSSVCTAISDTCLCDVNVTVSAVFTDATSVPSAEEISSQLHIGSPPPDTLDDGAYVQCITTACQAAADVTVFLAAASGATFDEHTIFRITVNATRVLYLRNKASTVSIGGAASAPTFTFRNPPKFLKFTQPTARDAQYETISLIEHLFYHTNLAPFIAMRLIQRFISSNPSPRFVQAVSTALATGRAGNRVFSNRYGDLGAALAALLLDREARSLTLDSDPTHGTLREPLLKMLHLMRSLEYKPKHGREVELSSVSSQTGMQAYESPSVFSFFLPEFEPDGPVASAGLVSPESELATGPFVIGALNGMSSLIRYGLTTCEGGFGSEAQGNRGCLSGSSTIRALADGHLAYEPTSGASGQIVANLDLLLTSGRMHAANREMIARAYDAKLAETGSRHSALQRAQELFSVAPEFHTVRYHHPPPRLSP